MTTASISETLDFEPTRAALAAALDEFDELGRSGGGAIDAQARRIALDAYARFGRERATFPKRWRYDYAALAFDDLQWLTGRVRVSALPKTQARGDASSVALETENAGGIVHAGSIYLEPARALGDPRITLRSLADAIVAEPQRLAQFRPNDALVRTDRFVALATAFQNCGAYVNIPARVRLDAPVQIVWSARPGPASAVFPRTVVRLGAQARATIVERHVGDTEAFVCGTVEIDLGPGARLDYVVVQDAGDSARIVVHRSVRCAEDATIVFHLAELGGTLVRDVVSADVGGARAHAGLNALFFARGFEHVDLRLGVALGASGAQSHSVIRSAASGRGQGRLRGELAVAPGTRGCRASLLVDALVLSRDAYIEALPTLEIGANDVAAAHAVRIGSLDEEQLFYVQSRGFARGSAERMIALAFFEAAIARFPSAALREEVRTALDERLDELGDTFEA